MTVKNAFRIVLAAVVLLASQAAMALGLGQLRMKSGLGEPLLAEIPIVSSVPGELERLHIGLASPETFTRIGLEPPRGVVANLQFSLALGDNGQPVVRITSVQPIDEPMLNFLVEVDWGQGRLVREYTALVDAPRTVAAPLAPPVQAAVVTPSNTIVRPPVDTAPPVETGDEVEAVQAEGGVATALDESAPAAAPAPVPAAPVQVAPAPAAPAPPVATARPGQVRVETGDTLSEIARDLGLEGSLEQAMIALLRSNPGAFIDGNVHLVRSGALLRVPGEVDVAAVDAAQALAQVREQTRAWRQATQTVAQPAPADVEDASGQALAEASVAGSTDSDSAAPAGDDARLEIVPPDASDATAAGSRSGISDGGEGDTMRQELQQANETLAAREAELEEIKSRLAELEEIQSDQQQLISMKDNELASVQAELAQAREAAADSDLDAGAAGWWIGGGVLLALVLLGAWLLQRRADQVPRFRAPVAPATVPPPENSLSSAFSPAPAPKPAATEAFPSPAIAPATGVGAAPAPGVEPEPGAEPGPGLESRAETGASGEPVAGAAALGSDDTEAPGNERLELARAFMQLGDVDSARQLLTELVVNGSLASRQEASRLLRELD